MDVYKNRSLRTVSILSLVTVFSGGLSVAAHANEAMLYSANAPITYKVANPNGSVINMQQSPLGVAQPAVALPQMPGHLAPAPMAAATVAPNFGPGHINRDLQPYQSVGNAYIVNGTKYTPKHEPDYNKVGTASWYGEKFHGKPTASGEAYNMHAMTAAHPTLPFNSFVIVTNVENGKSAKVRINDRGPFVNNAMIDLSEGAAAKIGDLNGGLMNVSVQYAGPAKPSNYVGAPAPQAANDSASLGPVQSVPVQSAPVAAQPAPSTLEYEPMRDQSANDQSQSAQNANDLAPVYVPNIQMPAAGPAFPRNRFGATPSIPQAYNPGEEDGIVTLTIKGPIHMAVSKSSHPQKARVIPAIHRMTYPSKK